MSEQDYQGVEATAIVDDDGVSFSFNNGEQLFEHLTVNGTMRLSNEELVRFPHEMVCYVFDPVRKSDEPLSKIHRLKEPSDYLTPDFISISEAVVVHEIKTCYINNAYIRRINEAREIYSDEIKRRCAIINKPYGFHHIVVTRERVYTSDISISSEKKKKMIQMYNSALLVKAAASNSGWVYENDADYSDDVRQMLSDIKKMTIPEDSDTPLISKKLLNHWSSISPSDAKSESISQMNKLAKDSTKMVNEKIRDMKSKSLQEIELEYTTDSLKRVREFWEKHDNHANSEKGPGQKKSVVQLPVFICKPVIKDQSNHARLASLHKCLILETRAHSRLWARAIEWTSHNLDKVLFNDSEVLTEVDSKTKRRNHFRVKPQMTLDDKVKLATVGIEARRYKDDSIVQEIVKNSSKGFKSNCDVDDIEKFVNKHRLTNMSLESAFSDRANILMNRAKEMISESASYNPYTVDVEDFMTRFNKSDLGMALEQLDYIIQEVNISRQQYCNRGEFILKSLPEINAHILIKPTNPGTQIFFSVLVEKKHMIKHYDKPFKLMHDFGDVYISEFVSLNPHSVTHYLYMKEKAAMLLATWMNLHSEYLSIPFQEISDECMMHFNTSLLFWMEGKEQTSKEVQQVRYAYMECAMDNMINHNPLKILSKWEEFSRSRLCVWMRRQVCTCIINMKPGKRYTSSSDFELSAFDKSLDKECELLSWVTGNPVGKFEIALNLSYFGVLHNKEDSKEVHGFLKIFSKVISEELKMRDVDKDKMGYSSPPAESLKSHEFNAKFVCAIGDKIAEILKKKHGDTKSWILRAGCKRLLSRNILDLATMKKSATGDLSRSEHVESSKENERITCLEASINLMNSDTDSKVMKNIGQMAVDVQKEYGGIVSNLFKKLQIGGVREIFVLEFRCRLVVHFLESLSRKICEELDNEMLTKGKGKLSRSDKHFAQVISHIRPSRTSATVINSDDATTWAQRFVMPVFGCFLSRLLPDEFVQPIMFILNLVTNKKLELPSQLLELYDKHPHEVGFDDGMNELKRQYLGLSEHSDLLDSGNRMLKNQSNMMQGILHYTSSLLHSGFMYLWEDYSSNVIKQSCYLSFGLKPHNVQIVSTTKVSSDDSSCIMSVVCEKEPDRKGKNPITPRNLQVVMMMLTEMKGHLYPLMACKQSKEKSSTSSHSHIEEFNSLWYYKNTLLTPVIKFAAQAIRTHPNSKMDDRFQTYGNLRKDLFEHGGNIMLCQLAQLCQMSAHYKTLGLMTNKHFDMFSDKLLSKPHPCAGFFLMEHPLCCGMFGHDMATYMACRDEGFRNRHLSLHRDNSMEFTVDGRPTVRTYLSFGQSRKYFAFKAKLAINDSEIINYFNQNTMNLYRDVKDREGTLMELKLRASNPALSESMAFQTDSKLHAASAYILQDKVMLQSKGMFSASHSHKTLFDIIESLPDGKSTDEFKWLFPFSEFYDTVLKSLAVYKRSSMGAVLNKRSVCNKLDVNTSSLLQSVTLLQAVQRLWFKMPDIRGASYAHGIVWSYYKKELPWLEETCDATLEKSPFTSHVSLRNYIISKSTKKKTVTTYAPSNVVSSPMEIVRSVIENCQWKGRRLHYECVETIPDVDSSMRLLTERVWRSLRAPYIGDKADLVEEILSRTTDLFASVKIVSKIYNLSKGQVALGILSKFAKMKQEKNLRDQIIPSYIERYRMGVLGGFTTRQNLIEGRWMGPCVFSGTMEGMRIEIHAQDDIATKLVCRNKEELKYCSHTVRNYLREMGWSCLSKPRGIGQDYWDFSSQKVVKTKHHASIAFETKDLRSLPGMNIRTLKMEVSRYDSIRLVNTDGDRRYTVLSYRIVPRDLGLNQTHDNFEMVGQPMVSSWLKSDTVSVESIEEEVLSDRSFDMWACDTLRRRLIGMNRMPNLDSVFEQKSDTSSATSFDADAINNFMDMAATEMLTAEEALEFEALFGSPSSSVSDPQEDHNRGFAEFFDEPDFKDLSWLDCFKETVVPAMSVDSSISNRFFDDFIYEYDDVFKELLISYMVKMPASLKDLVILKRSRVKENEAFSFNSTSYAELV